MTHPVAVLVHGAALGLAVSLPPGPNTALCLRLARDGVKPVVPLVFAAAFTDAGYAFAYSSGLLAASSAGALAALRWVSPAFLALSAILLWPRGERALRPVAAVAVAALNPATAALWLGLGTTASWAAPTPTTLLLLPAGAFMATAVWHMLLGALGVCSTKRVGGALTARRTARALSVGLLALAAVRMVTLVAW